MSKTTHITRALTMGAASLALAGAAYAGTAIGHAETLHETEVRFENTICSYLDSNPTFAGVRTVVAVQQESGIDNANIGRLTVAAVHNICPQHKALVLAWARS